MAPAPTEISGRVFERISRGITGGKEGKLLKKSIEEFKKKHWEIHERIPP